MALTAVGVVLAGGAVMAGTASADTVEHRQNPSGWFDASVIHGDFDGDHGTDVALIGATGWTSVPVAISNGDGSFHTANPHSPGAAAFADWASGAGVRALTGDFSGDGRTDIALLPGPNTPWWYTIPLAVSNSDGSFTVTNTPARDFAGWAQVPGGAAVTGDFDHDGRTDIALLPGPNAPWWVTLPVAFSNGDGTFRITNAPQSDFAGWSQAAGRTAVTGDYNHDGRTDIALLPGPATAWWVTLPVAFSNGDGTFTVTNTPASDFAGWSQVPGRTAVAGDFNHDGRSDIALLPGPNTPWWFTLPVAFSNGDGTFRITNAPMSAFIGLAQSPGVKVIGGDFNNDGRTDIALTGVAGWNSAPVAFSTGDGTFTTVTSPTLGQFAGWAAMPGAQVIDGDFNNDGRTDIALTGVAGWYSMPVALSTGDGTFTTVNTLNLADFGAWAAPGPSGLDPPGSLLLQTFADRVIVNWVDRSTSEQNFDIQKRTSTGDWSTVHTIATRDARGQGDPYAWTDTDRDGVTGQCYRAVVRNMSSYNASAERCTVRPSGIPDVPNRARQWSGLSSVNDGTGTLATTATASGQTAHLYHNHQTFGVDLDFQSGESLWKVEAEGGPQLMKGQAVALRVWGGGWLTLGDPTWGIGLGLDMDHPSYEWFVLGGALGEPLGEGTFALWNFKKHDFLVYGYRAIGVSLFWNKDLLDGGGGGSPPPGIRSYQMYNCSSAHHAVSVWVQDLDNGLPFASKGTLDQQYGSDGCVTAGSVPFKYDPPIDYHHYRVVATDKMLPGCGGIDDPNVSACRALTTDFISDRRSDPLAHTWNGVLRTDVVNGSTSVTPCTEAVCGPVPHV